MTKDTREARSPCQAARWHYLSQYDLKHAQFNDDAMADAFDAGWQAATRAAEAEIERLKEVATGNNNIAVNLREINDSIRAENAGLMRVIEGQRADLKVAVDALEEISKGGGTAGRHIKTASTALSRLTNNEGEVR